MRSAKMRSAVYRRPHSTEEAPSFWLQARAQQRLVGYFKRLQGRWMSDVMFRHLMVQQAPLCADISQRNFDLVPTASSPQDSAAIQATWWLPPLPNLTCKTASHASAPTLFSNGNMDSFLDDKAMEGTPSKHRAYHQK